MTGPVTYWHVDDINESLARSLAAGGETQQPVNDVGGGRQIATVKDADGNPIGLLQDPPGGAAQRHSGDEPAHIDGDEDEQEHDHDAVERHERDAPRVPTRAPPANAEEVATIATTPTTTPTTGPTPPAIPSTGRTHGNTMYVSRHRVPGDHDREAEEASRLVLDRRSRGRSRRGRGWRWSCWAW